MSTCTGGCGKQIEGMCLECLEGARILNAYARQRQSKFLGFVQGFLRAIPHRAGSADYAPYLIPDEALIQLLALLHEAVFTPEGDPRTVPVVGETGLFVIRESPAMPPTVEEFVQALTQFQHAVERLADVKRRDGTYNTPAERIGAHNAADTEVSATGDRVLDLFRKAKEGK